MLDVFFFFNDPATTEIYTLSLHDALPICGHPGPDRLACISCDTRRIRSRMATSRSEEHTSELQSHSDLVCRLLLEKKKKVVKQVYITKQINILVHYPNDIRRHYYQYLCYK